jgi:3-hydroxyacyl-[acyl-carrier-protein] dehydratase
MELSGSFFSVLSSEVAEGLGTYNLRLDRDHFIFRCHFPEQPIVPGVCIVQMLSELIAGYAGRKLYVKEMRRVKFVGPVYPDQTPELSYRITSYNDDGQTVTVSAVLTPLGEGSNVLCKLSLTLTSEAF